LICQQGVADERKAPEQAIEERKLFQSQELITAQSGSWIFKPGQTPRIVWRDIETIRRLGGDPRLHVRWFDANLNEADEPNKPGRWLAWVEGTAPNGTPLRRGLTFFCLPEKLPVATIPDLTVSLPHFPGPNAPAVLREHQGEVLRLANTMLPRTVMDNEQGAILLAGFAEFKPLGHPARFVDSATVLNDDHHLALKLKVQRPRKEFRPLAPPRHRESPATVLRQGTAAEAGMRPDDKAMIDAVCRAWAEDTSEPFVTVVARHGVVVTHEAFGVDPSGRPITRDYRCWVASITKSVTALLFSQFVDQGLVDWDDRLSAVFPDYPPNSPHVPTFRQCLTHTSGLSGHGEFGGMRNPHYENIILNGIDVNQPGSRYAYCGTGFELVAKAMELMARTSAVRVYDEHLFRPLGFGDVPIGNASSDGEFTAMELAILAQWVANRGSYGGKEYITSETFAELLPTPVTVPPHDGVAEQGIGLHPIRHMKPGAPAGSKRSEDLLFSPATIGHGSFSGCVFLIDPQQQLVIAQVRKKSGPRSAEWSQKFLQAVADAVEPPTSSPVRSTPTSSPSNAQ
jgi:CubicO group peptidase (beta-lactamase class C family)